MIFSSMISPGITTGIPGGHGHALSAEILPTAFSTGITSLLAKTASRGVKAVFGRVNVKGVISFCP